jgi:hypothetical protein
MAAAGYRPVINLMTRQSVDQLNSGFYAKLLENMMGVDLYGSLTQGEPLRYSFVRVTPSNQKRDLLFPIRQRNGLMCVLAALLLREFGLDVGKPICPQSKQTVREHSTLLRRVRGWFLRGFHLGPNKRAPITFNRETVTAKRLHAVT